MSDPAILAKGLGREFLREGVRTRALEALDLELPRGSIFGFLGPNGAGKTTTIRLLLGLLDPTEGEAHVLGFNVRMQGSSVRLHCGALLERDGLYDRLTGHDNLEFYARAWRIAKPERGKRIRELLEHFGLWDRRADPVGTWSRGMRQKLALARALLHRPQLVFLDEPTAGLDPAAAAVLREDLQRLVARESVTVFLTTHNLAEAERLCDRIGVLARGRLRAFGTLTELRARSGATTVEIAASGVNEGMIAQIAATPGVRTVSPVTGGLAVSLDARTPVAPIVRLLVEQGAEIEEVRRDDASLEQLYLDLVQDPAEPARKDAAA